MKKMFPGLVLDPEDLYLLESFQIGYLPGWVPESELATLLRWYPGVESFLRRKDPSVVDFLDRIAKENPACEGEDDPDAAFQEVLWTIADLLVYVKSPDVYDGLEFHGWDFTEITSLTDIDGRRVVDAGSGTGRVALQAAACAAEVYAVEPVGRLREFIRQKCRERGLRNLFVTDGFLNSIPLPDGFADVLITSHALGWDLRNELAEVQRVTAGGGCIIHCPGTALAEGNDGNHPVLVSSPWNYDFSVYEESDGKKRKYWKYL
jgi:SAM-dependent methyltransferase